MGGEDGGGEGRGLGLKKLAREGAAERERRRLGLKKLTRGAPGHTFLKKAGGDKGAGREGGGEGQF